MLGINRKNIRHDRDSNSEPTACQPCCPNSTAVIYFLTKKFGIFGLEKNDPTERKFFLAYYICGGK